MILPRIGCLSHRTVGTAVAAHSCMARIRKMLTLVVLLGASCHGSERPVEQPPPPVPLHDPETKPDPPTVPGEPKVGAETSGNVPAAALPNAPPAGYAPPVLPATVVGGRGGIGGEGALGGTGPGTPGIGGIAGTAAISERARD